MRLTLRIASKLRRNRQLQRQLAGKGVGIGAPHVSASAAARWLEHAKSAGACFVRILPAAAMLALPIASARAERTMVVLQTWNPSATNPDNVAILIDRDKALETAVSTAWDMSRGPICDQVKAKLDNFVITGGISGGRVEEASCDLSKLRSVTVLPPSTGRSSPIGPQPGNLTLRIITDPSSVGAKINLKDSPDFRVRVPLTVQADITIGTGDGQLVIVRSVVTKANIGEPDIKGTTFFGDFTAAVGVALGKTFGVRARDLIQREVDDKDFVPVTMVQQINTVLASTTRRISGATGLGIWNANGRVVFAFRPRFPILATGFISGFVEGQASNGPQCTSITLTAETSAMPGTLTDPTVTPARFRAAAIAKLPPVRASNPETVGDRLRCRFSLARAVPGAAYRVIAAGPAVQADTLAQVVRAEPSERTVRAPDRNVNFTVSSRLAGGTRILDKVRTEPEVILPGGTVLTDRSKPVTGGTQPITTPGPKVKPVRKPRAPKKAIP